MTEISNLILMSLAFFSCRQSDNKHNASYDSIVKFKMEEKIYFPDFSIEYVGSKSILGPNNAKWSMTTFYFNLRNVNQIKQISWSSGIGEIAPMPFEFCQKKFLIELKYAEKMKTWLKDNEFSISKYE